MMATLAGSKKGAEVRFHGRLSGMGLDRLKCRRFSKLCGHGFWLLTFPVLQDHQGVYGHRRAVGPDLQGIDIHLGHRFVLEPDLAERHQDLRQNRLIDGGFAPETVR